ncbi:hypothetical protein JW859_09050 [bacterium]|nr:hypothetical protein [bacterium]
MYSMFYYAWPFLAIVIGPLFVWNCVKALAGREGMYDEGNTSYMIIMNYLGIILGIGAFGWGVWRLYQIIAIVLW